MKPSNCFVAEDGRVKIGDFGLAKSLSGAVHLTKTGSFLGTPLFASPEQVRNDPLNQQTDVYSVAATLYFLLTGRAPFQGKDAAATLARIVADPVPSMQTLRPEIPVALDKVVLKGLERNRERRYRNLGEFRQALHPFLANQLSIAGLGLRFGAYWIDVMIPGIATGALSLFVIFVLLNFPDDPRSDAWFSIGWSLLFGGYFLVTEWLGGCSLGKWLTRLRVCPAGGRAAPGFFPMCLRTALFILLISLGSWVGDLARLFGRPFADAKLGDPAWIVEVSLSLFGLILLLAPMRKRNGYRGLHEWASGTRVIRMPQPPRRRVLRARLPDQGASDLIQPVGFPEQIGSFAVHGAITWSPQSSVLLGEDPALKRQVWIWLRPLAAAPLAEVRHQTDRSTRLRWLAGGKDAQWQWDAFLAPTGTSITNLIRDGSLTWAEVRPLFEELTDELAAAEKDGTLPDSLTVDQVWIQPTGQVQLLDMNVAQASTCSNAVAKPAASSLALLHEFAALALEGAPRPPGNAEAHIRSPLPVHAADLLRRLRAPQQPFENLEQVQTALRQTQNQPTELTRGRRLELLVVSSILHAGLAPVFLTPFVAPFTLRSASRPGLLIFFLCFIILSIVWTFLTRQGISLPLSKITLVDAAGRRAPRWRCAARIALFWLPWLVLIGLSEVHWGATLAAWGWAAPLLNWAVPIALVSLAVVYLISIFWSPARSFHDRLAGTFLVPR